MLKNRRRTRWRRALSAIDGRGAELFAEGATGACQSPLQQSPSLQQPVSSPSSAPAPRQSPPAQAGAQPEPEPSGQPGAATQQKTSSPPGTVSSRRHHESRRRDPNDRAHHLDERHDSVERPLCDRAGSWSFLVEGRWFHARSACPGWEAGERLSLRVRPSGRCALLNRTRHRARAMSCAGP